MLKELPPLPSILTDEMVKAGLPMENGETFHAENPMAFMATWNAINASIGAGVELTREQAQKIAAQFYSGTIPGNIPANDLVALGLLV